MFNKISSKALTTIFVVLLVLAAIYIYFDSSREERSFKRNIVNIDTSKVTALSIYPKANNHKEIKIYRTGNNWNIQLTNPPIIPKLKILLISFLRLKPIVLLPRMKVNGVNFKWILRAHG